jgi:hypothetical protein
LTKPDGIVTDTHGNSLSGVIVEYQKKRSITNELGWFSLSHSTSDTLFIRAVGFKSKKVIFTGKNSAKITLEAQVPEVYQLP